MQATLAGEQHPHSYWPHSSSPRHDHSDITFYHIIVISNVSHKLAPLRGASRLRIARRLRLGACLASCKPAVAKGKSAELGAAAAARAAAADGGVVLRVVRRVCIAERQALQVLAHERRGRLAARLRGGSGCASLAQRRPRLRAVATGMRTSDSQIAALLCRGMQDMHRGFCQNRRGC